jgi:hypothetical protein
MFDMLKKCKNDILAKSKMNYTIFQKKVKEKIKRKRKEERRKEKGVR